MYNVQYGNYFGKQTDEFSRDILHTNFYVPKGLYWCKNLNCFGEKYGHQEMDILYAL